ncbi:amidohydrolase [Salisediminibacterium selenitireducens]|uniref:Amidohydrolase 3 n=1 Tax=Bacillus selenitireducens (strain ATCC 700615 / DSM 15326 / MLS10) TaxID=439292 RepID=D6XSQ4_BACIE|nr:amidohydrolase [Salisediminibacterium selenitireducens]ADH98840.1 Amidohydrolase 3 [[Bacillus] selenitireducens MLS10]
MATIYYNGSVRTMNEASDVTEAVVTEDGIILETGSERDMRARYGDRISREIDIKGGCMYPGFTDSHLHMIGHGEKLLTLDVSTATSIEVLQEKLREKARATPVGEWVIAEGFNDNFYPDRRIPDRRVLDEVSTDHPILITRVCRHAVVVNTKAITRAGLSKETPDPSGGRIERYPDGEPTGYLHDQAQELVKYCLPVQKFADIERALHTSVQDLLANGFTGGHTEDLFYYGNPVETVRVFEDVIDGTNCKFRTSLLVHHEAAKVVFDTYPDGPRPSYIDFNAVKIFTDGALGGRTAYLSEPYADQPDTQGVAIHTQEQLTALVSLARSYRMPVAVHAIGDQALEETLTAIEAHPPPTGKRDRIIHAQILRPELIERMKASPVVLDLQPRFTISDFPWVTERLGNERIQSCYAWKTLLEEGLMCAGGSDAPIEPVSPMEGIYAAVMRRSPGDNHEGYMPDQKLSLHQAISLYTHGAAQAVGMEHRRGQVRADYDADFTILEQDLFALSPEDWLSVKTLMTVVDDTIMYESDPDSLRD